MGKINKPKIAPVVAIYCSCGNAIIIKQTEIISLPCDKCKKVYTIEMMEKMLVDYYNTLH